MNWIYFAYGSNLNPDQMRARCPDSTLLGPAILRDYFLHFGGYSPRWRGAVASVRPLRGALAYGALYRLSDADISSLDRFEDVPREYLRERVVTGPLEDPEKVLWAPEHHAELEGVRMAPDATPHVPSMTYRFAQEWTPGLPSEEYHGVIQRAFERYGFPLQVLSNALKASRTRSCG